MESGEKETSSKHGGKRSKQGRTKQAFKDVEDTRKYPRIQGFFDAVSPPSVGTGNINPDSVAPTKRSRVDVANTSSHSTFASPIEPPDVAPPASSFLLGKGGIISQALSALSSGSLHLSVRLTHHSLTYSLCIQVWNLLFTP